MYLELINSIFDIILFKKIKKSYLMDQGLEVSSLSVCSVIGFSSIVCNSVVVVEVLKDIEILLWIFWKFFPNSFKPAIDIPEVATESALKDKECA